MQGFADFSQLERADVGVASPNAGLTAAIDRVESSLPREVTVVREFGDVPAFECRPRALNQLYLNLLQNAVEAVGVRGEITVATRVDDGDAVLTIGDDGPGIPPEFRTRIFDLGFTTKRQQVGRGIGLALARHVVEQHRGSIEVESSKRGTTVNVRLPL